jgi:uncharacterized protein involved in exopolysaccharide biosynthesis
MNGHNEVEKGGHTTVHGSRLTSHDEINLLDYWRIIMKYRKMIAGIVAAASVAAVIISLLLPKYYKAEALIIPISSKSGGSGLGALASQFGGLASMAGISLQGGAGDAEKIMAILKSRTLAENVINSENLMPVLFEKQIDAKTGKLKTNDPKKTPNMEMAVKKLKAAVTIMDDKKNKTIKIAGVFRNPQLSARIVNAYLAELQKFISSNAFTMAKRNRIFIEGQLEENKSELLEAGKEINEFYTGKKISSTDARVDVPIANREPSTVNREMNIASTSETVYDPRVTSHETLANPFIGIADAGTPDPAQGSRLTAHDNSELSGLISQKEDLEKKITEARTVKNVPQQVYLSYLMLRRELLAKVNALLTSQYEMAKIEESKEELSFQVIDKAVPPVLRFKPKRAQLCIMSFMAALFGAIFLAFFREYLQRMKELHRMEQMDGRR